ncbi:MAG TPA: alpha/beta hydrolase family protein, partial [Pirellulales bacterium]|nr:alpha/beta hydrolase family protein [Pirellulales bacterium]
RFRTHRWIAASAAIVVASFVIGAFPAFADQPSADVRRGTIAFEPTGDERGVPKQFQLLAHRFDFEQTPIDTASQTFRIWQVTFPSPVVTDEANNNTVHCEYFCPLAAGSHPGVIMLHILGGDFDLSRLFCRSLAEQGVAALFVKMPYYGPRRTTGSRQRMVSYDPEATVRGMTQAVLDVRQATAWLAAQNEVDPERLGVMGISLGGITSALAASAEPRLQNVCLILAGGDIGQVAWDSRHLAPLRTRWEEQGKTHDALVELLRPVDPVTYAKNVQGRRILMLNAEHDEIIPRACTDSLWQALGKPEIVWWNATHFTAIQYLFEGMNRATRFFRESVPANSPAREPAEAAGGL